MGYPARLLGQGEEIEIGLRTHWKALIRPVLVLLLTLAVAFFLAAVVPSGAAQGPLWIAIGVVAGVIVLKWTLWPWLVWLTTNYVITNRRLVMRVGVVTRQGRDIPLARINDVSFEKGLLDRLLGSGRLVVESAGEHGQILLNDIPRVEFTQATLFRLVEEEQRRLERNDRNQP